MQGLDRVREGVQLEVLWNEPVEPVKLQHFLDEDKKHRRRISRLS